MGAKAILAELGRRALGKLVQVALEEAAWRVSEKTRNELAGLVAKVALDTIDLTSQTIEARVAEAERRGYERGRTGK